MKEIKQLAEITISYRPRISDMPIIVTSTDAYAELKEFFNEEQIYLQEQFLVMYLNTGNRVLGIYKLSTGGISGTIADLRLILATALKSASSAMILCHNHPSGNLKPSNADIDITKKIVAASKLMDLKVLDHLIISPCGNFYSFADEGLI